MQLKDYGKKTREVIKCQPGWYRGADIWLTRTKRGGIRLYVYNGRYMDASLVDIDPATLDQADIAAIDAALPAKRVTLPDIDILADNPYLNKTRNPIPEPKTNHKRR
jgi:hypothetical protein